MRWLSRLLVILLLLVALAAAVIVWRLWRPLPQRDGSMTVRGLSQRVAIVRDADGVPHIRATDERDALFALGYVHAQDRLWQMEFQRRIVGGRLAEILGPAALDTDRLMRTIGFARAGADALRSLPPETRSLLDAYVAGINEYLSTRSGWNLPVEFALLRFAPAPWRPEDVLGWQKAMGWSMSMNWREELLRLRIASRVGVDSTLDLLPASVPGGPIVLPQYAGAADAAVRRSKTRAPARAPLATDRISFLFSSLFPFEPAVGGSNNWVVSGSRTTTGKPMLANDPHLGTQTPAVWYVAHITGGALDVIGATLPGTPAVVIGHNRRIAWGVTNMMSDVQDFFAERINGRDEVLVDGRWEPMRVLHETIVVRSAPDVTLRVRLTRHGPLLSDVFDERTPLALRWTGHDPADRTAGAFLAVNRAGSWTEFLSAFRDYHLPMLNFVYADVDGNIGYVGPGALPIRTGDGRWPLDGSVSSNDWTGYVPQPELPQVLNPPQGFVATANNQVVPDSYSHLVSTSWEAPYRAARITSVLESLPRASMDDMKRLQVDQRSAQPPRILPWLLQAHPESDAARAALGELKRWDGRVAADSSAAALFKTFYARAISKIFGDDLGPDVWSEYRGYTSSVAKALDLVAHSPQSRWCDDVTTAENEDCPRILGDALELALEDLRLLQGSNPQKWRWDKQNDVWFPHLPFQASAVLRPFFSRHVARGGDAFTVNPSMPMRDQLLVSSYRQILDLGDFDRSVFILPLGQSGQLLSGQYSNMLDDWNAGRYRPLRFTQTAVDRDAAHTLTLEPKR